MLIKPYKIKDMMIGPEGNSYFCFATMGLTWGKFSSLPAKKPRKFETATGKEISAT